MSALLTIPEFLTIKINDNNFVCALPGKSHLNYLQVSSSAFPFQIWERKCINNNFLYSARTLQKCFYRLSCQNGSWLYSKDAAAGCEYLLLLAVSEVSTFVDRDFYLERAVDVYLFARHTKVHIWFMKRTYYILSVRTKCKIQNIKYFTPFCWGIGNTYIQYIYRILTVTQKTEAHR